MTTVLKLLNQCPDHIKIFTLFQNKIFYSKNEVLLSYDIYTNHVKQCQIFGSFIDDIYRIDDKLFILQGNLYEMYDITKSQKKGHIFFNNPPTKSKIYQNNLYILTDDRIYTLSTDKVEFKPLNSDLINKNHSQRNHVLKNSSNETYGSSNFKDFAITENFFILSNDGQVFMDGVCLNLGTIGEIRAIEVYPDNLLHVLTKAAVFVYKMHLNIPVLQYQFNSRVKYLYNNFAILSDQIIELQAGLPIKIINDMVELRECAVNENFLYLFSNIDQNPTIFDLKGRTICSGLNLNLLNDSTPPHLQKSTIEIRMSQLFSSIDYYMQSKRLNELSVADFRVKIIDTLKSIYIELSSLKESFKDKIAVLEKRHTEYEQKVRNIETRRQHIMDRVRLCQNKLKSAIQMKKCAIMDLIHENSVLSDGKLDEIEHLKILKRHIAEAQMQNIALTKICRDYL
ncbi:hypothetical protein M153_3860003090 [Pseudoloma neurophilia]|uniref:Uncharacterized protein n=1 Tax=Pseudoloma neurophilia TaxID=146866 RepID=A0A0R0M1S8_9MICR|nr:hypothetical protein M153_3860003090 [Pseudoloma neurophilia]